MIDSNNIYYHINKYIKKLYLFKIFKGLVLSIFIVSLLYLSIVLIQYYFYFSIVVKKVIFISFFIVTFLVLSEFVLINILKRFKILPVISNYKAAEDISNFFPDIKDKLVNILELIDQNGNNNSLVLASIQQKIDQIKLFDFSNAISFKDINKYLKYFAFPLILLLFMIIYDSSILKEGNKKFVNYSVFYEPESLFSFNLLNDNLIVEAGEDLEVKMMFTGQVIPDNVFITFGDNLIPMIKDNNNRAVFSYNFKSINRTFDFYFTTQGVNSKNFSVKVLPSPNIIEYSVSVVPPSYTGKSSFELKNTGDFLVPYGSRVEYFYKTQNVDSLYLIVDSVSNPAVLKNKVFTTSVFAKKSFEYNVVVKNENFSKNILKYNVNVIPDLFPNIFVDQIKDSANFSLFYFNGNVNDDYGFSQLNFNYAIAENNSDLNSLIFKKIKLPLSLGQLSQNFYYLFDFNDIELSENEYVTYYFSVSDNDVISQFKTSKSQIFSYRPLTRDQIDSNLNNLNNSVQNKIKSSQDLLNDLQMDIDKFNQRMINEKMSDWEMKNMLDQILQKKSQLDNLLENLNKDNQSKIDNLKQLSEKNDELLEKEKLIQELLDDLLTDEMKKMLDSLQALQKDFNKDALKDLLKNADKNFDDLDNNLDNTFELLKRMEVEQELNSTISELEKLSDQLQKLGDNINNKKDLNSSFQDSVLSTEFKYDQLMQDYDSLLNKNSELDKPFDLDSLSDEDEGVKEDFKDLKDNMFDLNKQDTKKDINKTSDDMKKMSDAMKQMMSSNMMQANGEDIEAIKFLLSNLLTFSFEQEKIYNQTKGDLSIFSDNYNKIQNSQLSLSDDFNIIADSLNSLAKRNPMVGSVIKNELYTIRDNLLTAKDKLLAGDKSAARISQRNIITSVNKLALMLEESLQNMQSQMSNPGSGSSKGNSKPMPGIGDLKQLQKSMKDQLQQMLDQMNNGKQPGSSDFGQQLAKREAFQKMLQDMLNNGDLTDEMKNLIQEMMQMNDDIKSDVINKNITPSTLLRDKEITTRLLEAENSDNQRKLSNQRQSNTTDDILHQIPDSVKDLFEYNKFNNDILSKRNIKLNNFYKQYFNEYIQRLAE